MVKVVIKLLDSGKTETFIGSEKDALERLYHLFPSETEHTGRLLSAIEAINEDGFGEVEISSYTPPVGASKLAPDYDQDVVRDDPWPREGDQG